MSKIEGLVPAYTHLQVEWLLTFDPNVEWDKSLVCGQLVTATGFLFLLFLLGCLPLLACILLMGVVNAWSSKIQKPM